MKKLIALISSVAIVSCFSLSTFAATATTEYVDPDKTGYGTFYTTISGSVGNQATILAYADNKADPGLKLSGDTNIEFIDQKTSADGDTIFEYKMKSEVKAGQEYVIMIGGSTLDSAVTASVDNYVPLEADEPSKGNKIFGNIANVTPFEWFSDHTEDGDGCLDELCYEGWKSTIKVCTELLGDAIASVDADTTDGSFEIADLEPGKYIVEFNRAGYATRFMLVDVSEGDFNVGEIELYAGDVDFSMEVDGSDTEAIFVQNGSEFWETMSEDVYTFASDYDNSFAIDGSDVETVFANQGNGWLTYDGIDDVLNY